MFLSHEALIQKEYRSLLHRSLANPSTEQLYEIITELVELDKGTQLTPVSNKLSFEIEELAFRIFYNRRNTADINEISLGIISQQYQSSGKTLDEILLEGYTKLMNHPGFANLGQREAKRSTVTNIFKVLTEAVNKAQNEGVLSPPSR